MKTTISILKRNHDEYYNFFKVEMEGHHPDSHQFEEVYESLEGRYPEPYFKIEVTYWETTNRLVDMSAEKVI